MRKENSLIPPIVHSCYFSASTKGEQFVPVHTFSFQESGSVIANDGTKEYIFNEGDFRFAVANKLAKYKKIPPPNGAYRTVAIFFDEAMLREFNSTYGFSCDRTVPTDAFIKLKPHKAYSDLVASLIPYLDADGLLDTELLKLKAKEALLIILKINPELKNILFDFSQPGKIDLAAFMQQNYHFKVGLERFAFLTGRSLATFKRDFKEIFNSSPGRWLTWRRLQAGKYLIEEQSKRPSEIYAELGFESLSHFTYAFRRAFGVSPGKA
ncbi:helix-turn-helix domain-containing protein [Mucilaginibacter terrae]|nr:AraC family transcriptional regulator [Mucilaginibacter terrae]